MYRPEQCATLARLEAELRLLKSEDAYRRLEHTSGINLCSNDYLGLSSDARLAEAVRAALAEGVPVCSTGSRLLSGNAPIWEELEAELARFTGSEAALFFSSGYLANVGLLSAILGREDFVFSDSSNHASIIDGIRLSGAQKVVFPHRDLDFLEDHLRRLSAAVGKKIIVVESVFSMEGDCFPLAELSTLAALYGAELIIDEAHATGVFGPEGRGLVAASGLTDCVLATVHTCGKALAAAGAYVACSETLKHYLVNRARTFIFSTALPPYLAAQIRAALRIAASADEQRRHLANLGSTLRAGLKQAGFDVGRSDSQIVPVVLGPNEVALQMAEEMRRQGFGVRAIRPPSVPRGSARLRLSLTATLSIETIEKLVEALVAARERLRTASPKPLA